MKKMLIFFGILALLTLHLTGCGQASLSSMPPLPAAQDTTLCENNPESTEQSIKYEIYQVTYDASGQQILKQIESQADLANQEIILSEIEAQLRERHAQGGTDSGWMQIYGDTIQIILPPVPTPPWKLLIGDLPAIEEPLEELEAVETPNGFHIFGNRYYFFNYAEKMMGASDCGWTIDLALLTAMGKTENGTIILASTREAPPICVAVNEAGETHCLLREDIFNKGIGAFEFSDFDVHCEHPVVTEREAESLLWFYHTEKKDANMRGYGVLDGAYDFGEVQLTHLEYPALQYTIRFFICENVLYMQDATYELGEPLIAIPMN